MSSTQLDLRPLTPALQKVAVEELHEMPDRIAQDIAALRDWVAKQPHLRARTSDQFLVAFLRGCKYSLEKAKKKLDNYYTLRSNLPDLFQNFVDDQRVRTIVSMGVSLYLPLPLGEDGPRIMLIRTGHYPVDQYNLYEIMKANILSQDLQLIHDDNAVVSGLMQVLDFEEFSATHFLQMSPSKMKRMSHYFEEAMPMRMKASHFINTGPGFEMTFSTIKPMLPSRVTQRMKVHANMESLYEHVPQKYLPKEYGGENGSIDEIVAATVAKLLEYREYLLEEKNYGTDEKLRPGKPIDFENLFGAEGSFRSLNVD